MVDTFAKYGIAETRLGSTERLRDNIQYEENVLSYPKCSSYHFCSAKTFYVEQNSCSAGINMVATGAQGCRCRRRLGSSTRGPQVSAKGSLALILPTSWAPSSHKAADGHAFRRHLWSALFARRLSQTADMVASGGSDSSAQVLRNSRPEFRPPDASTYGFITEMLTTRASGVGAPEIM